MTSAQGLRREFAEERVVFASQPAQVPDTATGGDLRDGIAIRIGVEQLLADAVQLT